ncbi:MAG: hypothetical protein EB084_22055 [Proteobacteria bacterium]|nr:hypothetical protein [Pseudomonadota bacterium]
MKEKPKEPPPPAPLAYVLPVLDAPVHIRLEQQHRDKMLALRDILLRFPGPNSVYLHLVSAGGTSLMALDDAFAVRPNDALFDSVKQLLGDGTVWRDKGA